MMNPRKVAVIGVALWGGPSRLALMQKGLFSEDGAHSANHAKRRGRRWDLSHGLPYTASMDIYARGL